MSSPVGTASTNGGRVLDVLICDDDREIRELVAEGLQLQGYSVITATHGREALKLLTASGRVPRVILTDMRMPIVDGWAFAGELRSRGIAAPIIVMTAATNARAWAREIQAAGCLPKLFELRELLTTVAGFLPPPRRSVDPNATPSAT